MNQKTDGDDDEKPREDPPSDLSGTWTADESVDTRKKPADGTAARKRMRTKTAEKEKITHQQRWDAMVGAKGTDFERLFWFCLSSYHLSPSPSSEVQSLKSKFMLKPAFVSLYFILSDAVWLFAHFCLLNLQEFKRIHGKLAVCRRTLQSMNVRRLTGSFFCCFYARPGHCRVPNRYPEDPQLGEFRQIWRA